MGYALCGAAGGIGSLVNGSLQTAGMSAQGSPIAVENQANFISRIAGEFSRLTVNVTTGGTSATIRLRKNTANGNMVISPTDSTTGLFTDTTHADTIAAGDVFCFSWAEATPPSVSFTRMLFTATGTHAAFYASGGGGTPVHLNFMGLAGLTDAGNPTEANASFLIRTAGTMAFLQCWVATNALSGNSQIKSRKNAANGNMVLNIGAGLTGRFEDTTNTDAVASGDKFCSQIALGTGSGFTFGMVGVTFQNPAAPQNDITAKTVTVQTRAASATPTLLSIFGGMSQQTVEASATITHGFPVLCSRMRIFVASNTAAAAMTMTFRKNGGAGNQTLSIAAGVTGWFEDVTNSDLCAPGDLVCFSIVGGTSGGIDIRQAGLTELDLSSPAFSRAEDLKYLRM